MKNYFGFNLTGKKFFPIWILFLLFFGAPYGAIIFMTTQVQPGNKPSALMFPLLLLMMIVAYVFSFYVTKLSIENTAYKDKSLEFKGNLGKYLLKVILGLFLSIITLGVYLAWFISDLQRYLVNSSSYNSENLEFNGKGGKLFLILTLTLLVPMIAVIILMTTFLISFKEQTSTITFIYPIVLFIVLIPYIYFVYKWMVDVNYKSYHITWETNCWSSCGKIALEILLSVITIGIYSPLANLRLYKYFAEKTVAVGNDRKLTFGYDIDPLNDFLFIWGQILLTIVTLTIYYPWAYCKVRSRILGKTYLGQN